MLGIFNGYSSTPASAYQWVSSKASMDRSADSCAQGIPKIWHRARAKSRYVGTNKDFKMILDLCLYYYVLLREAIENHDQRYPIKDFQTSHIQKESLFGVNHVLVSTSLCWGGVLVEGCVDRWPRPYFFVMYLSLPLSFFCSLSLVFSSLCPCSYSCLTVILDSNTCRANGCFFVASERCLRRCPSIPRPKNAEWPKKPWVGESTILSEAEVSGKQQTALVWKPEAEGREANLGWKEERILDL